MAMTAEQIRGGIVGLLVGDALGVPYEFHDPRDLPSLADIEFQPPRSFRRSHASVPSGTWSDDGSQALCLAASLCELGQFDPDDIGRRFVAWADDGYLAVDGRVFDIGITTGEALRNLRHVPQAIDAGPVGEQSNGNGSLMRVLPLALWHRGNDAELIRDARLQSRITHGHVRSQICCALYCLWVRNVAAGIKTAWSDAADVLRREIANDAVASHELDHAIRPGMSANITGSGYVVDCLRSAFWACEQGSFEMVVKSAVSLGRDTDTTACVAGGVAGVRDGESGIPQRWKDSLRGQELLQPLLDRFCDCVLS